MKKLSLQTCIQLCIIYLTRMYIQYSSIHLFQISVHSYQCSTMVYAMGILLSWYCPKSKKIYHWPMHKYLHTSCKDILKISHRKLISNSRSIDIKPSWTVHSYLAVHKIIPGLPPQITSEDHWSPFPGKKRETQMPLPLATSLRAVERLTNHQSTSHSLAAENLVNCHSLWLPSWDSYWVILWWQSQKGVQIPLRPTVLVYKTFKYIF